MNEVGLIRNALEALTPGTAGVWTLVLMVAVYLLREWRETRKLSAEDRLARRDGYAAQVAMLMTENRSLRTDLAALEVRHDEYRRTCQEETANLRRQIFQLEGEVSRLGKLAQVQKCAKRCIDFAADEVELGRLRGDGR